MPDLYEFIGPNFRFPIEVEWHDVICEAREHPRVPLLPIQKRAFDSEMVRLTGDFREGAWWIPYEQAKTAIIPSMQTDPEQVLEWKPIPAETQTRVQDYSNPFIEAYTKSEYSIIRDNLVAEFVWQSFCKFMLTRLLNDQLPIDMGFATLYPVQVRVDWKEKAAQWERAHVQSDMHNPKVDSIIERKAADFIAADNVIGIGTDGKGKVANWSLEIVPSSPFEILASRLEGEKRRRENVYYWRGVYDQLRRQLPYAIEIYSAYLEKARQPYALLYRSGAHQLPGVSGGERQQMGVPVESPVGGIPNPPITHISKTKRLKAALEKKD